MTTIKSLLQEMQSFVKINEDVIADATECGINSKNNKQFKSLLNGWINGRYDEDPDELVFQLKELVRKSLNETKRDNSIKKMEAIVNKFKYRKDMSCARAKNILLEDMYAEIVEYTKGKNERFADFTTEMASYWTYHHSKKLCVQMFEMIHTIPSVYVFFDDKKLYRELYLHLRQKGYVR